MLLLPKNHVFIKMMRATDVAIIIMDNRNNYNKIFVKINVNNDNKMYEIKLIN